MSQHYYRAVQSKTMAGMWVGQVYHYDATGNRPIVVWQSPSNQTTKNEALDDAAEYVDENNIDAEMDD